MKSREIFVPKLILLANFVNLGVLNPKNFGSIFSEHVFRCHFEFQNGRHFKVLFDPYLML